MQSKTLKIMKEELLAALENAMMKYNEMNESNDGNIGGLEEAGMKIFQAIQIVKKSI